MSTDILRHKWKCTNRVFGQVVATDYWVQLFEDYERLRGSLKDAVDEMNMHLCVKKTNKELLVTDFPNHSGNPLNQKVASNSDLDSFKLDSKYSPVAPEPMYTMAKIAPPGGVTCCRCGQKNPDAGPNMKDGRYKCYSCR